MRRDLGMALILAGAVLAVYGQTVRHEFINYDDTAYVTDNPYVRTGLTWRGVTWAFTSTRECNWHPLTWMSHMLDCQVFGRQPGGHHLVNVLLHIANSVLLYVVLKRMTGAVWRSAAVAALFALHPTHVESVAWVAERKDVLSTAFWMLTLLAYTFYVAQPSRWRYGLVVLFFVLGLMAKPMLVTLPFVLLLLDYWPLGRLRWGENVRRLVGEKLPLFILAAVSSVVTYVAQQVGGAMTPIEVLPVGSRLANALVSYVAYLGKALWPSHLAVFYPYASAPSAWQVAGAGLAIAGVTLFVAMASRRRPVLTVGWLWYVGTLVPVIGMVQVGLQSMADRYTYIPFIGLFLFVVWGAADRFSGSRPGRIILGTAGGTVILALGVAAAFQVSYWKDSLTLFQHTAVVTKDNPVAHSILGITLQQQGKLEEAIAHYRAELRIWPWDADGYTALGEALLAQGKKDEGIAAYRKGLTLWPQNPVGHNNLGVALVAKDEPKEAKRHYAEALRLKPDYAEAHANLALLLVDEGQLDEAVDQAREALRIMPDFPNGYNTLGIALARQKKWDEAAAQYREAVRLKPDHAEAHRNLALALAMQGQAEEAAKEYHVSIRLRPDDSETRYNLGSLLAALGRMTEAVEQWREAVRLKPQDPVPTNHLAWILAAHPEGRFRDGAEAVRLAEKACALSNRKDPSFLDTLAAAYAEAGRFSDAVAAAEEAMARARALDAKDLMPDIEKRLQLYWAKRPFRDVSLVKAAEMP